MSHIDQPAFSSKNDTIKIGSVSEVFSLVVPNDIYSTTNTSEKQWGIPGYIIEQVAWKPNTILNTLLKFV